MQIIPTRSGYVGYILDRTSGRAKYFKVLEELMKSLRWRTIHRPNFAVVVPLEEGWTTVNYANGVLA